MTTPDAIRARREYVLETLSVLWFLFAPHRSVRSHPDVSRAPGALTARCRRRGEQLGIETIEVFVWDHPFINAIPVGTRRRGTLVLSNRLIAFLDDERLDAAIVHELGHIKGAHDRRFAGAVGLIACAVLLASSGLRRQGPRALLALPVVAILVVLALLGLVRRYERQADRAAVEVLGDSRALAGAILAVQTGDPRVDVHGFVPRPRSRFGRLFDLYPRAEDRFPELIDRDR